MSEHLGMYDHVAVRLNNYIVVIGGFDRNNKPVPMHVIWLYNVYTDHWRKYHTPGSKSTPPPLEGTCAAAIDADIYMFGGYNTETCRLTNEIWKLTRAPQGCFDWSKIEYQDDVKLPSPQTGHSGWEYDKYLWIFGGDGLGSPEYLDDHGDFSNGFSNQLLCYDPSMHMWTNPQCFGAVPSPRWAHSTDIINDKVWLFGGEDSSNVELDDFFQLDMQSRVWTEIMTGQTKPQRRAFASLSAIFDKQLVLHGGDTGQLPLTSTFAVGTGPVKTITPGDTWIMDLPSQTWRKYTPYQHHSRQCHTSSLGANKSVVIIGGHDFRDTDYVPTFHLMLEPKSLQQLAMKTIYSNKDVLPWKCLPSKLFAQLGLLENMRDSE